MKPQASMALIGAGILLVAGALGLARFQGPEHAQPILPSADRVTREAPRLELTAADNERAPDSEPLTSPAEAFLSNYWGDRWPAVKAALDANEVPYAQWEAITIPWEAAASEIEKRLPLKEEERSSYKNQFMGWKGVADREWMLSRFGSAPPLDAQASAEVSDIAERHAREIEPFVDEILNALEAEVFNAWRSGRFVRAPYTTVGAPGAGKKGFYSKGDGHEGWTASLSLAWEDVPYLESIRQDIDKRVRARDEEVREFLGRWRMANQGKINNPR